MYPNNHVRKSRQDHKMHAADGSNNQLANVCGDLAKPLVGDSMSVPGALSEILKFFNSAMHTTSSSYLCLKYHAVAPSVFHHCSLKSPQGAGPIL